jgi:hypothetical protein
MAKEDSAGLQKVCGLTDAESRLRLSDILVANRPGTKQMVDACKFFIANPVWMVTLWGGAGNAKTMCLQGCVNELVERCVPAVYITAFDLFGYIREAFNHQREIVSDSAYMRLQRFENVRVLALDELDKVRPTEWMMDQLTDLIDKRYRRGDTLGTLIAMNADPTSQPDWIASRLFLSRNQVIHNTDGDLRPVLTPAGSRSRRDRLGS